MPKLTIAYEKVNKHPLAKPIELLSSGHAYGILQNGSEETVFDFNHDSVSRNISLKTRAMDLLANLTSSSIFGLGTSALVLFGMAQAGFTPLFAFTAAALSAIAAMRTYTPFLARTFNRDADEKTINKLTADNHITIDISQADYDKITNRLEEDNLKPQLYFTVGRNCVTQLNDIINEADLGIEKAYMHTPASYLKALKNQHSPRSTTAPAMN